MNNITKEIKQLIEKHDKIALFHHTMPDGDSLSSSFALVKAIKKTYPNKEVVWLANEEYLNERFWYMDFDFQNNNVESIDESYLAILGDCSDPARTYKGEEFEKAGIKIIFDHHRNEAAIESSIFWHEPTWPASAMQSYLIAKEFVKEWDEELSILFYFGIMTDTNRFAYSFANTFPLKISVELFENISDEALSNLYTSMNRRSLKGLKFEGWVLNNFKVEDEVAFLKINKEDQDKLGLTPDDCARVNMIGNIEGVKIWMFFIQYPWGIRTEFRSLGVPVNEIAKKFDGGGHIRAAGCKLEDMSKADEVIKAAKEAL